MTALYNIPACLTSNHLSDGKKALYVIAWDPHSAIETRLFPLQSLYDPLQAKMSKIDSNEHGKWLLDTINTTVVQTKRTDGKPNGWWVPVLMFEALRWRAH
jgi:hypothetical protein